MAKKKSNRTTGILAIGGAVAVIALIALVLIAGTDVLAINPFVSEGFEIPIPLTDEELQENEDLINEQDDLLTNPPIEFEECFIENTVEGQIIETPCPIDGGGTDETVEEINEMLNEEDPLDPNLNGTTSTDPPIDQICDEFDLNCGGSAKLQLQTSITKIDSAGNSELVEDVFDVPLASFFVEDSTNIDYSTGRLEIKLSVKGDPNTQFTGSGEVDLLINGQTILTSPLTVEVDGTGEVDLLFGGISDTFTVSFADHFDKFVNQQPTPILVQIKSLDVSSSTDDFAMVDQDVFVMTILRDDFRILIVDEQGVTIRVYPTDSVIRLTTTSTTPSAGYCTIGQQSVVACGRVSCGSCALSGSKSGSFPNSCIGTIKGTSGTIIPAPSLTGINLFDQTGQFLLSSAGGSSGVVFDELVTRNENYTIEILSPSLTGDVSYGKPQETQSYVCKPTFSVSYNVVKTRTSSYCGQCPLGGLPCLYIDTWRLVPTFTARPTECNFP